MDALALGFLVGGIGVWGLSWGLKVLISLNEASLNSENTRHGNFKLFLSISLLIGQFMLSAFLLKKGADRGHSPLQLGLGLVAGIFFWVFMGALAGKFRDQKKNKQT